MRLIDADEFIKFIDKGKYRNPDELIFSENDVCEMIENQPTAFDVEEVLEHLQTERRKWIEGVEQTQAMGLDELRINLSGRAFGTSEAIKTIETEKLKQHIKRGGI